MKTNIIFLILFCSMNLFGQDQNKNYVDSLLRIGFEKLDVNKIEEAREVFNEIILLDSMCYKAYEGRARIYRLTGFYDEGLSEINKALHIKPLYNSGLTMRAELYMGKKDYEKALADIEIVLDKEPNYARAISDLGVIYFIKGDYKTARKKLKLASKLNPESYVILNNIGIVELNRGSYGKAITNFTKALKLTVNYLSYTGRGASKYYLRDYDGALKDYQKAFELNSNSPQLLINIGLIYYNFNDINTAVSFFNTALKIDNNNKNGYYNRGLAYYEIGKYKEALADFEKSCELGFKRACEKSKITQRKLK